MAFRVGQKVVCVDTAARWYTRKQPGPNLTKGATYTIRDIDTRYVLAWGVLIVRLEEIIGEIVGTTDPHEAGYASDRFRPAVEKKAETDAGMAILREILDRESIEDRTTPRSPVKIAER